MTFGEFSKVSDFYNTGETRNFQKAKSTQKTEFVIVLKPAAGNYQ